MPEVASSHTLPDIFVKGEVIVNDPAPSAVYVVCLATFKVLPSAVKDKDELLL